MNRLNGDSTTGSTGDYKPNQFLMSPWLNPFQLCALV
jgi:hypothetical protein